MKTLTKTHLIVLVVLLTAFVSCKVHKAPSTSSSTEEGLIVGTWVAEGNATSYYSVYESSGIAKRYSDNELYKTYNWEIVRGTTSSGLTIPHLKLVNVFDETDVYDFEIDALNDERMVLVYQRGEGFGIAKPATYLRQ